MKTTKAPEKTFDDAKQLIEALKYSKNVGVSINRNIINKVYNPKTGKSDDIEPYTVVSINFNFRGE